MHPVDTYTLEVRVTVEEMVILTNSVRKYAVDNHGDIDDDSIQELVDLFTLLMVHVRACVRDIAFGTLRSEQIKNQVITDDLVRMVNRIQHWQFRVAELNHPYSTNS